MRVDRTNRGMAGTARSAGSSTGELPRSLKPRILERQQTQGNSHQLPRANIDKGLLRPYVTTTSNPLTVLEMHREANAPRAPTPFQATRTCNKLRRYTGIPMRCCP